MPDYLGVLGGLGLFLLGMKNMSEGIQAIAGTRLRHLIGAGTNNRLSATGVGVLVTMLVQSSSITTVITVGFVSAGLMTLVQAIGVIMGANIGTTITGWILVIKIGKYGLPLLGASAFVYLFIKNDRWRYIALACMGLGMIFFGLELMKNGFSTLKGEPWFEEWFNTFRADSYFGVLKCALVGCVLTFIVQSSSATLGITIGLTLTGVIPFETAAALVLGENIGTTITAFLASLAATTDARRAAYFHILFNLLGVMWITAIFPWYISLVKYMVTGDPDAVISVGDSTEAIATTHTGFNVANTLLFMPFTGLFARLLQRLVPDKAVVDHPQLSRLDMRMLKSPMIAIEQSRVEVLRMGESCISMLNDLREVLTGDRLDEEKVQRILDREKELDQVEHEVALFLTNLLEANVPHEFVDEARRLLRIADEYESVSDYVSRVVKAHRRLRRADLGLAEEEQARLLGLHDHVVEYLNLVKEAGELDQPAAMRRTTEKAQAISQQVKGLAEDFLEKIPQLDPRIDAAYNREILSYRRIRDHVLNIAQAFAGEK